MFILGPKISVFKSSWAAFKFWASNNNLRGVPKLSMVPQESLSRLSSDSSCLGKNSVARSMALLGSSSQPISSKRFMILHLKASENLNHDEIPNNWPHTVWRDHESGQYKWVGQLL